MRNYLLILFAFAFAPASLYAQMFGGQLKSTKAGSITALNCASATNNGTLTQGTSASGVSSLIAYTGGNGAAHNGQTVTSTGVTGLTATLSAGTFANGAGSLTYNITGTPGASGTASFLLNIGGQSCIINITVALNNATASCGATNVHKPNLSYGSMTDQDGNTYKTIVIGTQEWMAENLKASHYRNGAAIDLVTNNTTWAGLTTGATCWYNIDSASYNCPYGKLYNWYAVADSRGMCPIGWHVPSDYEWKILTKFLDSTADTNCANCNIAGIFLKSAGTQFWQSNTANNSSGFSALPGGLRQYSDGAYSDIGGFCYFWSSTQDNIIANAAKSRIIYYSQDVASAYSGNKRFGFSVRCTKDIAPPQGSINNLDCGSSNNNGTLTSGTAASAVSFIVPYTGGNGGAHNGQTVTSTGVIGLTATLAAGSFANGAGSLNYTITGTPSASGTASFALSIGGQSCVISINVLSASTPAYPPNSVFCANGPTSVVDVTNPTTGRIWMDRNLGATQAATSSTDANSYGDLYQWGRRSDGHQCRNSPITNTLSSSDQPANGNFILVSNTPFDWRNPQNNNLWQGINGVNNPCPSGYRLPTEAELETERLSWSSNNLQGAFSSPLKLPMAGLREESIGSLVSVGVFGSYWCSMVFGVNNSHYLYFNSSFAGLSSTYRASGFSLRCLKDVSSPQGSINNLDCGSANNNGTLISGTAASGVSSLVPYTGGNGGTHNGQTITSTGVTGLTATLAASIFATGAGNLTYIITGTPSASGTASFALSIGGQSCVISINVLSASTPAYPPNSVFCANGPTSVVEVTNPTTGRIWMDRNLGASQAAISSTDANSYGDLYQWGRRSDGHQCRTSATTTTLSSTDQPANASFILAQNSPWDWRSPQNDNLWQGVNGVNNPCPGGYRLPTEAELEAERLSWSSNNAQGAFASALKLPVAGYRSSSNGSLLNVGTGGRYWSSSVNGVYSQFLYFSSSNAFMGFNYRASGRSVRCLKHVSSPQGSINTIDCGSATNNGTLTQGTAASGVSSIVLYTGGNGGTHNGQTVTSTGVTGLTATLAAGTFTNGAGSLTYTITGTPSASGTASFALSIGGQSCALTRTVGLPAGSITALNCGSATNNGTLYSGTAASGVSSSVSYTGGNGGTYSSQNVTSTGVTGLTATLIAGTFAIGAGSLTYTITGTPSSSGTANFALNIGGQTCTLTFLVSAAQPSVFCASGPTVIVDVTNPATGRIWMDRNLGATQVATSSTDANAYGDLYQWGRRSDGHQCRNSATTTTLSSTDQPANSSFILALSSPYDWRTPQSVNLWQGVNGVNNPCPSGYRLPTDTEWSVEYASWNYAWALASPLKLPLGGFRYYNSGSLSAVGGAGFYWSSSAGSTISFDLAFNSDYIDSASSGYRATGKSVRCIKN
jgi:uncharacterized protein (TIGR02145 family)